MRSTANQLEPMYPTRSYPRQSHTEGVLLKINFRGKLSEPEKYRVLLGNNPKVFNKDASSK